MRIRLRISDRLAASKLPAEWEQLPGFTRPKADGQQAASATGHWHMSERPVSGSRMVAATIQVESRRRNTPPESERSRPSD